MLKRLFGGNSPTRCANQEAFTQQKGLIGIFNGGRLLANGVGKRGQTNWLAGELEEKAMAELA